MLIVAPKGVVACGVVDPAVMNRFGEDVDRRAFGPIRRVLTVRYEDLRSDTPASLARIARWLGHDLAVDEAARIAERNTVERLRALVLQLLLVWILAATPVGVNVYVLAARYNVGIATSTTAISCRAASVARRCSRCWSRR